MYLSSGRGRKSGGARATGATPSLAPLIFIKYPFVEQKFSKRALYIELDILKYMDTKWKYYVCNHNKIISSQTARLALGFRLFLFSRYFSTWFRIEQICMYSRSSELLFLFLFLRYYYYFVG